MRLVIICPSRERPRAAHQVFDSLMDTRTTDQVTLHFALDEGDPTFDKYPPGRRRYRSHNAVEALNLAFRDHVVPLGVDYVGCVCDEQRFVTKGWDEQVLGALDAQGGGLVFPNDLINPGTMPAAPFLSVKMMRAVGYLAHPEMTTNYYDNIQKDLAEGVGRVKYLPDVVVQHLSMPHKGDNSAAIAKDRQAYIKWYSEERPTEVARARAALGVRP